MKVFPNLGLALCIGCGLLSGHGDGKVPAPAPTYGNDIAPILRESCVPCHRPGGGGPFPLQSYEDVRKHASQIADVTRRRYMPPWLPEAPRDAFFEERRLSALQIQRISEWVAAKCPIGDAQIATADWNQPTESQHWQLGTPDLVLPATAPLHLAAGGRDVFWNFLFSTPLKEPRYVRAIEIQPGNTRLVHHANLLIDRAGDSKRFEQTPGAGFAGMDFDLRRSLLDPESHFLFWKPGSPAYAEPAGFSWQLNPGNVLVLNTHLQPSGKDERVAPAVGVYFTDQAPTRYPILVELQGDQALIIPAGARDFTVEDHLVLPEDVHLLAIYPHAHYLGTLLEGTATLPDGTRKVLIRIPRWNLDQQSIYRYRQPVDLPKGTRISMRFHFDNSSGNPRNPNQPPKRVVAGNLASDEMAHLWLQLLPFGQGDHRRPIQEAVIRRRIEQTPGDARWHRNLAALLLSRLDPQGAISELRLAIRLDANRPEAYDMLGAALQNTGQLQGAIEQYRRSLQIEPAYLSAQYNLALALWKAGAWQEARDHLQVVAKAYPDSERLRRQMDELQTQLARESGRR